MISRRRPTTLALPVTALTALTLSACSLAADVTPPPGYATQAPVAVATPVPAYPVILPNPSQGAAIYAEKCAPCHGETGLGDGSQSDQLPNPAPAIGSPEIARRSAPADWYRTVTEGNLERFMPGFITSLSDSDRWDVVSYVYSLSSSPETMAEGEQIYQAECAACHGEKGKGDGSQAAGLSTPPTNLADPSVMSRRSGDQIFQAISAGAAPDMPAYEDKLDEDQRWAVTDYIRSLTLGGQPRSGEEAAVVENTPSPTEAGGATAPPNTDTTPQGTAQAETTDTTPTTGTVSGTVTNGSGGVIPTGVEITLHGFDGMQETFTETTQVAEDGSYSFSKVEILAGRVFLTSIEHNGVVFNSDIAHSEGGGQDLTLPIVVFDTSTDTAALYADRMHVFFDFTQPDVVQVVELFIVSNPTDRVITAVRPDQPVLKFDLPEEASNLQFQNGTLGGRFVETETGFGDLQSISPGMGQHQILFGYELPYDRRIDLELTTPLDVSAAVVMVPTVGIKAQSEQLQDTGEREVQGMKFRVYSANGLEAGNTLPVTLSGNPQGEDSAGIVDANSSTNLLVGLGALGAALIVAGIWFYSRRQQLQPSGDEEVETEDTQSTPEDPDGLIDAIIALDDLYRSGKLPEAVYRERRAELKDQLKGKLQ